MKVEDLLLFFSVNWILFDVRIEMIVPSKNRQLQIIRARSVKFSHELVGICHLPFSALLASSTTNLELLFKLLSHKSPPLGSVIRHQSCNCVILLEDGYKRDPTYGLLPKLSRSGLLFLSPSTCSGASITFIFFTIVVILVPVVVFIFVLGHIKQFFFVGVTLCLVQFIRLRVQSLVLCS
jgi:hypothetical protein